MVQIWRGRLHLPALGALDPEFSVADWPRRYFRHLHLEKSALGILEKEKGKRGGFKKKGPRLDGVQQRFYVLKLIDEENIDPEDDI